MKTAEQMLQNWLDGMASPTTAKRYKDGIQGFNGNPMAIAASDQAEQLYLQRVQQAVASGKRKAKLLAADPNSWKQNAMTIGASALQTGATKGKPKQRAHYQKWAPIYQQAHDAAAAIPKAPGFANAAARQAAALSVLMQAAGTA